MNAPPIAVQAAALREVTRDAGLRRGIGPWALTLALVNITVGAGIFSLPGGMAQAAGPYALAAYGVCAVAMGAVVLCFAEAGSRAPTSGGVYGYVDAAFGPLPGFVAGVLLWLSCVLACGGIASALAGAVGGLVPGLAGPLPRAGLIVGAIGLLAGVNLLGVGPASRLISIATAVKLVPLALFVGVGLFFVSPARLGEGAAASLGGVGRAVILSLFAFQGMETVLGANGEVDRPARNLPRALVAAMLFVTALYVLIQLVAQGLLGGELAGASSPLAQAIGRVDPRLGAIVLAGAAVSMFGWIGSDLLGAPRVLFAFARDGFLPAALGRVHPRTQVPVAAVATHAAIAAALGVTGSFEQLAVLSVLSSCLLYMGGCAAAWVLRRRGVALAGEPVRVPGLAVWAGLGCLSMAAVVALARPAEIAGTAAAVGLSVLLYALLRRRRA